MGTDTVHPLGAECSIDAAEKEQLKSHLETHQHQQQQLLEIGS